MASSDRGLSLEREYQVFLSFRGPDTRKTFTDVLYHSLINAGICVFRDNEDIRGGEIIDGSLQRAINNSRIYIPVFSKTYAESESCLCELMQIVANTSGSEGEERIIPIFFDVHPDDVVLETLRYRDAILKLEEEKKLSTGEAAACREALKKVGAIKGWEVEKHNGYGELVELVVKEVLEKLKTKHRSVTEYLVGIDDRVAEIIKLLDVNSGGVRFIQIYGMGGIGKTTLAKVVFNKLSSDFGKCCCFLEGIQAKSSRNDDLTVLQKILLSEVSHSTGTRSINDIDYGTRRIKDVLHQKKVLLVLDDVGNSKQVEELVRRGTLYSGSRILITTRNKGVLQTLKWEEDQKLEYEMEVMSCDDALQLFSKHAFNRDSPLDGYSDLSKEIVSAIGRLPLALEVIGPFLSRDKNQKHWEETLEDLRKAPHGDVSTTLRISYDALSPQQQQIFLDIACFFIGEKKNNAIYVWKDCGLLQYDGVGILQSMCLIKIVNNKFWMHDQLRDLGRAIVCEENLMNPEKRSRLWIHKDIIDIITIEEMKKNEFVQTLDIDLRKRDLKEIKSEEIERFEMLRCLKLNGGTIIGNLANRLTKLTYIFWSHPPPSSESATMHFKNVVVLRISKHDYMNDSMLQSLTEMAIKLEVLSIESCPSLTRIPCFSKCLKLKRLTFKGCSNLREMDSSIGELKSLIKLKIAGWNHLKDLPKEIGKLVNLENFFVKALDMCNLPDSIWELKSLRKLRFWGNRVCPYDNPYESWDWELPSAIKMLQNLEVLIFNAGVLGGRLPPEIGSLPHLRILDLSSTSLCEFPKSIDLLPCLQILELRQCPCIRELVALPTSLTRLVVNCSSLQVVPNISNLTNLVELELSNGYSRPFINKLQGKLQGLGRLTKLTTLDVGLHNVSGSTELASLHQLKELYLFGKDQKTFPQLPLSLQTLGLSDFNSAVSNFPNLRDLLSLHLYDSPMQELQLDGLQLPHLGGLYVRECEPLKRFRLSNMRKLTHFSVYLCTSLVEMRFSWSFELLEYLNIEYCNSLKKLLYVEEAGPDNNEFVKEMITCQGTLILPSEALKNLRFFALENFHNIQEIHIVGTSKWWESFVVRDCVSLQSLRGLSNLKNLQHLSVTDCYELQVVEGLDRLEFLNLLQVRDCDSLERLIDISTTKVPNDCHINIHFCEKLYDINKDFEGSVQSFKHYKEQESEKSKLEQEQELEQESEQSDLGQEQELEQESEQSDLGQEQELKPRRRLGIASSQQEQEQESHFKQEQELKRTRRQGGVSIQCLSLNSFLHCILPCFFPLD